ncbi:PRC-barrel domain-containing protein [Bosea sp. UC22_33]|uniref:PRC-barrel domain-containing protein n=1 Tax=Bosea sp. UC22_33 TaxID=3350165 RepID=UPI003673587D
MQPNCAALRRRILDRALAVASITMLTAVVLIPFGTGPAFPQNVVVLDVDVKEVAKGYRASKLSGSNVENAAGERIGSISDLIVDRDKVLFATLQVGGFLGLGTHLVAIPYNALEINADGSKIVLAQGSKERLQKMPEFKYQQQ